MDDILRRIKQVKYQCERHKKCTNCIFHVGKYRCKAKEVVYQLCKKPTDWNIENIEKTLKEEYDI